MTILITGANGFVGQALCRVLVHKGKTVKAAIRSTAVSPFPQTGCETIRIGEICSTTDWGEALSGVDTIVHLAARVHIMRDTSHDPLRDFRTVNVEGTASLAQQAVHAGVKRLIYLSSIKVNGEGSSAPYTEDVMPAPQDAYAVSKWEAEQLLHAVAKTRGLEVVILRPPLVYGPEVKANFYQLMNVVNRGIPIPFKGIHNRRSMIFVGNLADAVNACIELKQAVGGTYLVSDGSDLSIEELVRKLACALNRPARLFSFSEPVLRTASKLFGKTAAIDRLYGSLTADISRIQRELGWHPPYSIEQGLKETANWFCGKS